MTVAGSLYGGPASRNVRHVNTVTNAPVIVNEMRYRQSSAVSATFRARLASKPR